ncbi:protein INVOLVED IN DE NOVO 2-like [Bidens hawaiensis]|uniref:protein INVOLVED IN DE NOVO 2-like n=1 Tax=Bidens hawaiensis TaxID=980011 RepID=UPI00404B8296
MSQQVKVADNIECFDSTSVNLTPKQKADEDVLVWPWMAVVANIHVDYQNDGGDKLKDDWVNEGYGPIKVHLLLSLQDHFGLAVVEFGKSREGFFHVMKFMKAFQVNKHGRKDWFDTENTKDDKLYGWIATDEDYNSNGDVGNYLRKNCVLKTVADVQKEDESVVLGLRTMIDEMDKRTEELNGKISKIDVQLETIMKGKELMSENFDRDIETMHNEAQEQLNVVTTEHERTQWLLVEHEKELKPSEAIINETKKRSTDNGKKMIELAILEQKKADERALKLAEDHRREKEDLLQKSIELQKKLDEKHLLELTIKQMKRALEVMKQKSDEHLEKKNKMETIKRHLKEKDEQIEDLETSNQTLMLHIELKNHKLVETRKELIEGFTEITSRRVGVKRMGELDGKPCFDAAKKKEVSEYAIKLASLWEDHLRDPNWHPFKVINVKGTIMVITVYSFFFSCFYKTYI